MLRNELQEALHDEVETSSYHRPSSRSMGRRTIRSIESELTNSYVFSELVSSHRRNIADIMGWDISRSQSHNPFTKSQLKKLYDALTNRPQYNSWEYVLGWPRQTYTQD